MAGDVYKSVSELRLTVMAPTTTEPPRQELRLRCATSQFDIYYAAAERTLKINHTLDSAPTNQTVALIQIQSQYLSLVLLFLYCASSSRINIFSINAL